LMILILLTLLALSASQVTSLQERMAGVYRADNMAFQAAEQRLRETEQRVLQDPFACDLAPAGALPATWVDGTQTEPADRLENLNNPSSPDAGGIALAGSLRNGPRTPGSPSCLVFRISSFDVDSAAEPTSRAVVQSTYTP